MLSVLPASTLFFKAATLVATAGTAGLTAPADTKGTMWIKAMWNRADYVMHWPYGYG